MVGVAEILTAALLLSAILIVAGTLLIVINGLPDEISVAITVSLPSAMASVSTGIVIVPVV
ncbi:hypothetical protein D3C87_716190 [compost metagenome]